MKNFLVGDLFVLRNDYVLVLDFEKELLLIFIFKIYVVVIWLLYLDVLKVELIKEL